MNDGWTQDRPAALRRPPSCSFLHTVHSGDLDVPVSLLELLLNWVLCLLFLTNPLQQWLKMDRSSPAPSRVLLQVDGPLCPESPEAQGPATALSPSGWDLAQVGQPPVASSQIASASSSQLPLCHPPPQDPPELKTGCALEPVHLNCKHDIFLHELSDTTQFHFPSWATKPQGYQQWPLARYWNKYIRFKS